MYYGSEIVCTRVYTDISACVIDYEQRRSIPNVKHNGKHWKIGWCVCAFFKKKKKGGEMKGHE